MKTLLAILLALFATNAVANFWTRTNAVNGLSVNPATLTGTVGQIRLTVYALDGASSKDLSGLTSWLAITDNADGYTTNWSSNIENATGGLARGIAYLEAGNYTALLMVGASTNDALAFPVGWESIIITAAPAVGASSSSTTTALITSNTFPVTAGDVQADGDVNLLGNLYSWTTNFFAPIFNISITNIIGAVENHINNYVYNTNIVSMVNNIGGVQVFQTNQLAFGYQGGTNNPYFIELYSGGVMFTGVLDGANLRLYGAGGGGAGGITSFNGDTNPAQVVTVLWPLQISDFGAGLHAIGLGSTSGGIIIVPASTNIHRAYGYGATNQYWTAPAGTGGLAYAELWGPATMYSPGEYVDGWLSYTGGEVFTLTVGLGGQFVTNSTAGTLATATGGWPGGGSATSTNLLPAYSGAGYTAIQRGTGFVAIAAGGGGTRNQNYRVPGGGYSTGLALAGGAGTATNGGYAGSTNSQAGSYLTGGNASHLSGLCPGQAGSAGLYGGGAGGSGASSLDGFGGSGYGYAGGLLYGRMERSPTDTANPPGTSSAGWVSPWGVAPGVVTNYGRGNPGGISITIP